MSRPYIGYAEREDSDEPQCPECEVPQSWCQCEPTAECPQCGEAHPDTAGFGLLFCPDCGFCRCAVVDNGKCDRCGKAVTHAA